MTPWNELKADEEKIEHYKQRAWRSLNEYYVKLVEESDSEIAKRWDFDTSSEEAFLKSVAPNRKSFIEFLGGWPWNRDALEAQVLESTPTNICSIERVVIRAFDKVETDAIVFKPNKSSSEKFKAVIFVLGLGQMPELTYNMEQVRSLIELGITVLVPRMSGGPEFRRPLHRKATLMGHNLFGTEMFMLSRWVDYLESLSGQRPCRTGVYGLSQGGQTALFLPAAEERIACSVTNGWFNERRKKQIERSEYQVTYMDAFEEEDKIYPGHLVEFSDAYVAALICPRPLMIENGLSDLCTDHRQVQVEYDKIAPLYDCLGISDRIQKHTFEGGHHFHGEKAIPFLDHWLSK